MIHSRSTVSNLNPCYIHAFVQTHDYMLQIDAVKPSPINNMCSVWCMLTAALIGPQRSHTKRSSERCRPDSSVDTHGQHMFLCSTLNTLVNGHCFTWHTSNGTHVERIWLHRRVSIKKHTQLTQTQPTTTKNMAYCSHVAPYMLYTFHCPYRIWCAPKLHMFIISYTWVWILYDMLINCHIFTET